jgi:dTDP-glucose 4,6-dehydratase
MKIIVTGGSGFIGSTLIRKAIAAKHFVVNIDKRTYASRQDNLADACRGTNYAFCKIDVTDRAAVSGILAQFEPDAIIHLAAESHVDRSIESPLETLHVNTFGTGVLLEAARLYWQMLPPERQSKFRFVQVSTDEVFGTLGDSGRFNEQSAYAPSSPYGASKAGADHLARAWARTFGLPVIVTNCCNNYGPFQYPEKLIPATIVRAILGRPISVYGNGQNIRQWIHVDDHADALLLVLRAGAPGESYCIPGCMEASNIEIVRAACEFLDELHPDMGPHSRLIEFVSDRPGHDARYSLDGGYIEKSLSWKPAREFKEGLRSTVSWYVHNESWWAPLCDLPGVSSRLGLPVKNGDVG